MDKFHTFNIDNKYLQLIKSGEKRSEVRRYYLPVEGQRIGLINNDTDKIELVIKIGMILDLSLLEQEELDIVLDEAKVDSEFRKFYPCKYLYQITEIETVH